MPKQDKVQRINQKRATPTDALGLSGSVIIGGTAPGTLSATTVNNAAAPHTHEAEAEWDPRATESLIKTNPDGWVNLVRLYLDQLYAETGADLVVRLGGNDGSDALSIEDSDGVEVASIDSDGLLSAHGVVSAGDLLPQATDAYDLGSPAKLWRRGYLSELRALLFAEETIQLVGGWLIIPKDAGAFAADVADTDTKIDFGKAMTVSDWVLVRSYDASTGMPAAEYITVGALDAGTTYNVTRDVDGSGANDWAAGTPFLVLGQEGDGRIELNAYDTPRIQILQQGDAYNTYDEIVRIGDLDGAFGITEERYGFGVGDYAAGNYLRYDPTDGFVLVAGAGVVRLDAAGITLEGEDSSQARVKWVYGEESVADIGAWWAGGRNEGHFYVGEEDIVKVRTLTLAAKNSFDYYTMLELLVGMGEAQESYIHSVVAGHNKLELYPEISTFRSPLEIKEGRTYQRVTNGYFTDDSAWTWGANWTHNAVDGSAEHSAGSTAALYQDIGVLAGKRYRVQVSVVACSAGSFTTYLGGTAGTLISATGNYTEDIITANDDILSLVPTTDFVGAITYITAYLVTEPNISVDGSIIKSTAFGACVYRDSAQTWSDAGWNALAWNTEVEDTDDLWDSGTPTRFTIQHEGVYAISTGARWSGGVAAEIDRVMAVRINGDTILKQVNRRINSVAWEFQTISCVTPILAVDDYIEVLAKHDRGNTFGFDGASSSDYSPNTASIVRVP